MTLLKTCSRPARALFFFALSAVALSAAGCGGSAGPRAMLFGERTAKLGSHQLTIRPVGRWHSDVFAGEQQDADGKQMWVFSEGQTKIVIKDERLTVNSKPYGRLKEDDSVEVHSGRVYVNDKQVAAEGALASN